MTTYYPAANTDDGIELYNSSGSINLTTDPMTIRASVGNYRIGGIRVQLSGISQGDSISSALLYGYFSPASRDDLHVDVIGELVTTPPTFSTTAYEMSGRIGANPTTNTVEWDFTGSGAGWYSVDITSVVQELVNQSSWPSDGYIVLILDPRAYSDNKFGYMYSYGGAHPWYMDVLTNSVPTIVPNTADSVTLDAQAVLEATASDADGDDVTYEFEITDNPESFSSGETLIDSLETGSGIIVHAQPSATVNWLGNYQIDDRVAFAFQGKGGLLTSVDFYMGAQDNYASCEGVYTAYVYEVGGVSVDPVPGAWVASTAYSVGDYVRPTTTANSDLHYLFRCKTAGTSSATEPTWPVSSSSIVWSSAADEGDEINDGTVVWEVVYSQYPINYAAPEDTPTPGWLTKADDVSYNPSASDFGWKTLSFTGGNIIRTKPDKWYMVSVDWQPVSSDTDNYIAIQGVSLTDATAPGVMYLDGASINNNGPRIISDSYYRVRETYELLSKASDTDAGFVNTVTGGDTDPFNESEKVSFTVQPGNALENGTWYWRARASDPSGSNVWSSWTTTRSFNVNIPNIAVVAKNVRQRRIKPIVVR